CSVCSSLFIPSLGRTARCVLTRAAVCLPSTAERDCVYRPAVRVLKPELDGKGNESASLFVAVGSLEAEVIRSEGEQVVATYCSPIRPPALFAVAKVEIRLGLGR
ncbi:hypothetical protein CRENBAI_013113, partial [Crenichthys baileyi]